MQSHAQNTNESGVEQTYFAMFSLPRKLTIDTVALEHDFYKLSRRLHPDLYARKSAEEQAWSLRQGSLLNDAYRTLKDPVARTAYLLKLEGLRVEDENSETRDPVAKQNRVPADLLEEVFELNMQLEEMRANLKMGEDDPVLRGDLERAQVQFKGMLAAVDKDLHCAWATWDAALDANDAAVKDKQKNAMVALLDRRSYLRNLLREVDSVLSPQMTGVAKASI
ncbi:MAG TPA: Fe-S protein assembly co-chaperone HscB [Terracidiphilus sp.]|nr:Fe-S protein assembly co-chaperone HscB [Terracidiphilus sp.]